MLLFDQVPANIDDILSINKIIKFKQNNFENKIYTIRDAPSITLVNITIDFNLSSHIIRHKSSHVSDFGPRNNNF